MSLGEYLGAGAGITKGLYHLNGNSNDSSGNGNNGTDTNISYVAGKFGQCASFNGSSSKIVTSSTTACSFNYNEPFTVSFWVKNTKTSYIEEAIIHKQNPNSPYNGWLVAIAGSPSIFFRIMTNISQRIDSVVSITNNIWTYVTCTYDGSGTGDGQKIYINGEFKTNGTLSGSLGNNTNTTPLEFGQRGGRWFGGELDKVNIENRAWTATKIPKYFTFTKGRFGL